MGKVVTCWSPVPHTGVTTLSLLLANEFSKYHKVCVIDLNFNNPFISFYVQVQDFEHNIDNLKPYIEAKTLSEDIIQLNLTRYKNMSILQGTKQIDKGPLEPLENTEKILEITRGMFDIIVVDVNSALDNVGTFLGLKKADIIVTVLTQNIFHIKRFINKSDIINSINSSLLFVLNQYDTDVLFDTKNIKDFLKTSNLFTLPYIPRHVILNAINSQQDYLSVFENNKKFRQSFSEMFENLYNVLYRTSINTRERGKKFFLFRK